MVGAVINEGRHIITSPNFPYIFQPPLGPREIFLRSNMRFGDDDPLRWPQLFLPELAHLACIPRMGAFTSDPLVCDWLHRAKLPVWLIRPHTALESIRVKKVVSMLRPFGFIPDILPLSPAHPPIFRGPEYSLEKYIALNTHSAREPFGQFLALITPQPRFCTSLFLHI
jgi:hypothetical protein